jgi:hypothetical protein
VGVIATKGGECVKLPLFTVLPFIILSFTASITLHFFFIIFFSTASFGVTGLFIRGVTTFPSFFSYRHIVFFYF